MSRTWTVVLFGDDNCEDLARCPASAIACTSLAEAKSIAASLPAMMAPHILSTIAAAEFLAGSTVDN